MNKTKTIYKSIIYVSLALLVMTGVILFSSRALADPVGISFNSSEVNVYVDSTQATIAGTISVGENKTFNGLYYSLESINDQNLSGATQVTTEGDLFSQDITISSSGLNPDTNGQTVYFCLDTVDSTDSSNHSYSYNSINVKLLEPSISSNKSKMYIYPNTNQIGLTATVEQLEDTSEVSLIWSTSELNVGATIPNGFSNVPCTLGTDVYALSIEDLSEFTAENNPKTHGYLYAFKTTDKKVLAKERIDVVTESHDLTCTSNANIEIDLDNPGNFDGVNLPIYFNVDSYDNASTKIAYTYDAYELTDETETQIIDAIDVTGKSFSVNNSYFSVPVKPQNLSTDAETVYFYLFKNNTDGKVIFDTAQVSIKRKQLDIDNNAEFYLKNSNGRTDTLYLGVNENSVNGEFIITNESHEFDISNWDWDSWQWITENPNPYRLIVKEKNGSSNLINDASWDKESSYGKFNYKNQVTLSGFSSLSSIGKDYIAYLEYKVGNTSNYIQVEEYAFYVKPEIPEMIWKDSDINDSNKIKMPIYSEYLTANITGYKNGDVIAWTDTNIATADLKDWAQLDTTEVYSITDDGWNDKKVDFPVSDLPRTDETLKFYLIRNIAATNQDDMDVYPLGTYQVEYQALVNTYGKLNSASPILLSERVYRINNADYYFSSANADGSFSVTIPGYFKNGMNYDELIWTDTQMEEAAFQTWAADPNTEFVNTMAGTPPGNQTDYYNSYTLNISNVTLDEDNPTKTVYLYVRRKDSNGDYMDPKPLGTVIIKEAHKPELTSATSSSLNHNNDMNDLSISYSVEDYNAGIQTIKIYYKEDGQSRSPEIYNGNGYKLNDTFTGTYELKNVRDDDVTDITIEVYGYNGLVSTYNKVFASKPKLTVEPKGKLESFDRSDYYTASDRNEKFAVTVKNSTESIATNNAEEAYLTSLFIKVNNTILLDKTYSGSTTKEDKVEIDLADTRIPQSADNKYRVYVKATNSFNNVEESKFDFEVDSDKPQITGFVVGDDAKSAYGNTDSYTYITNKKVETEIKAEDNGSGGLKDIRYYWENTDGSKSNETVVEFNNHPDKANTKTTLDKSFKGFLFANADDMVGNKADKYSTFGGIIVDLPENHNSENHIDISVPDSGSKDKNGNPLYNKATGFTISVKDSFAGIKSVEWKVTSPNDKSANSSGSLNINDGNVGDGWSKNSTDKNIVTSVSKTITVDGNSDGMVLYVKMTDNAGNTSDKSITFSIDKVKPSISVTYGNQTGDPDFTNYYSDSRTATIVVKERNFNQDSANSIVSNSVGNKGTLSSWKEKVDATNPDNTTYTATITFDKDDRYNLSFQCSDKAGNSSDTVTTQEFVIDKTDPVLSVTFDRLAGINGYYSNTRTATISVKEINFDPGRVVIGGINGQNYTLSNWTRKDNTYSSMISFSKDGEFSFDVTVKDKAGNVGNSVQVSKFTIDQNKPEIIIEGVKDKAAYNGKVAPKITFKDTNIDKDSIKIELIGAINGKVDLTGKYTVSEDGLVFDFKNIENIKENDDLYTLRVTVRDLAGNVTVEEIKFSVNRFGSIYILGDNLKNINDKYVRLVKGLEITEINVNKIKKGSVIITLTVNGVPKTLVEGKDYKVEAVESDGDWKQYKYVFEDSLFGKDGSYILSVVSEDEAGNKNNNGNETKEAEIKFGVDSTAPIIAPVNFEADSYYDANGMDFSISVKDNMILDSVKVYVNNVEVKCTGEDEIYTFHVDESNKRQVIKVVAKDLAGNEAIESYEGILVAGNVLIRFLHNKLAIIIAAGSSSVLVLGGGIFLTIRLIARR